MAVCGGLDIGESGDKIAENFSRHHDGITVAADILGDLDDHAAVVLFQIEKKDFPIRQNFFGVQ